MRRYPAFDQTIEVEVRAFPAVWWLLSGFEVRIGQQVFHPRIDRAGFFSQPLTEFYLIADGRFITGMVRGIGPRITLMRKRYSLVVGMAELARDRQTIRGWVPACLMTAALWLGLNLAVCGAVALWWVITHRASPMQ